MPRAIRLYVRYVDAFNRRVGRATMYLVYVMLGLLLYMSVSRSVFNTPLNWGVEMAQFLMASYYLLGGAYSMQIDAHVRMDIFYSRWSPKGRALADVLTAFCLIFYLAVLLIGGIFSSEYAVVHGQKNYSAWAPPMAPIKIIMTFGVFLMLLQALSMFFKDVATLRGETLQ
ncbi:MAG: TRAP transporter small permease subunit [Gammaproteobacteria bacterium]|nr:TRAP transporter small permease subunit [Gammaproteobacteria bacterium]